MLPSATVTVTNKDTGASRVVQSGADGAFSIPALPPGPYDVLTEMSGFQPTVSPVEVAIGATSTVRLTLQVSSARKSSASIGAMTTVDCRRTGCRAWSGVSKSTACR